MNSSGPSPTAPAQAIDMQPTPAAAPLTQAERERIIYTWNATAQPYHLEQCLHHLIEAQVARTPDLIALVSDEMLRIGGAAQARPALTYAQLDERANRLARRLRSYGVAPETVVGLCAERSLDMVVAMLAILKAGAAYMPLDPSYPAERLVFMLDDARPPVVLVQRHLANRLPPHSASQLIIDEPWDDNGTDLPPVAVLPDHLAYLIYTSGSTGRPKGVGVSHRSIVNRLLWGQQAGPLDHSDRLLQKTPYSFDVSVWEFFWPLSVGARLVMSRPEGHIDPHYLADAVAYHGITTIHFVPSMLSVFLETADLSRCGTLRRVMCSGEALPLALQQRFFARLDVPLINLYGPTEAAVEVTAWTCDKATERPSVPIGFPVANTQMHILDQNFEPVPVGVPGELYIAGIQLARGYHNRPELTAERFIPNPFPERLETRGLRLGADDSAQASSLKPQGSRMYRTGDLARYEPDGSIVYLGRTDHQVKLRGARIELGEIEATLARHPVVRDAAVLVREDRPGDQQLVAYIVPAAEPEAENQEPGGGNGEHKAQSLHLKTFLRERLPEYMVPAVFVALKAMPLTTSGKTNRTALPPPTLLQNDPEYIYTPPRTPLERELAGIWAAVLGAGSVGTHDDFLLLGGHSIHAGQIVSRARHQMQVELSVRDLFEQATVAGLAALLEQGHRAALPPLVPVARNGTPRLSFAQQRLWFLNEWAPDSPIYNIPLALRLSGPLDSDLLARCLGAIVARHEALRTVFQSADGEPFQVIRPPEPVELPLADLSARPATEREAAALELARAEARRPFDLAAGPLLRAALLQLGAGDHLLVLSIHHIVADGWSMGVLCRELAALYDAGLRGAPVALPPLPVQYADYAAWQRDWLRDAVLEEHLGYWTRQLAGAPEALQLPTDRPRPAVQTYTGAVHRFTLPADLVDRLEQIGRTADATLFMTLLAAFQVLLARYTGQQDIVVGSPIAGRTAVEVEHLIGFFVNTLVLRGDLSGDPAFRTLLKRTRTTALDAYAHQDLPFERLVEALRPERDPSRTPIYQIAFVLETPPAQPAQIGDLRLTPVALDTQTAKTDLVLALEESGRELCGTLEYNSDLFDAATVARMAGHFQTLLEGIAASPDQKISRLPLLTEAERRQILLEWNATARPFPTDRLTHELVAAHAARHPQALAVADSATHLTYTELDARAERLAHFLRAHGAGPDVLIGVCLERSVALVLAELAVLKSGGAYVPLDPAHPAERLAFLARDAKVALLLTQQSLLDRLPSNSVRCVCLDSDWPAIAQIPDRAPAAPTLPEHLAYVIYTSGSTGTPKGVAISHASLLNLVFWHQRAYALTPADRCTQLAGPGFDASVWETWPALAAGAALLLASEATRLAPAALRDWLAETGATVGFAPTPLAEELIRLEWPTAIALRFLLTGGDRLTRRPPPGLPFALVNHYGPTECTVLATAGIVAPEAGQTEPPPIGSAATNATLYVLDHHGQPVPVGVPGELHIGGAGLARGYWNRPDLTAERFVPVRLEARDLRLGAEDTAQASSLKLQASRLYRTGDLVRYRPDGQIEFLGRVDQQVKIRGFRIELGEIEAALRRHPAVQDAAVLARAGAGGEQRLVAYVSAERFETPSAGVLRRHLQSVLPEYMVPAVFVALAQLPLTPNGKIDRRALPDPDLSNVEPSALFVAPRTPVEEVLASMWSEALGVPQVGVDDNFFDLGGHSLRATQVVSRIHQSFQVKLSVRDLFAAPTIAELAQYLVEQEPQPGRTTKIALVLKRVWNMTPEEREKMLQQKKTK